MITQFLPEFKVFEVNDLVGLRSGHMLSQVPVATGIAKVLGDKFIENGIIVGLDATGKIANYATGMNTMFVHYTEELNTIMSDLKYFAVPVEAEGDTYIRAIALYVGDSFTTNNYTGSVTGDGYAKVVNGVLTLQSTADKDTAFIAKKSTLPDGSAAYEFTFYRLPTAA